MSDEVRWVDNEEIDELLNVSTAACSICDGAARVPEDVAMVKKVGIEIRAFVVCSSCQPAFARKMRQVIEKMEGSE